EIEELKTRRNHLMHEVGCQNEAEMKEAEGTLCWMPVLPSEAASAIRSGQSSSRYSGKGFSMTGYPLRRNRSTAG
ncbi:MAG: hypothetical protein LUC90_03795, partial [Lachnospiraceae bacterium]|nr:hypothetical protein [Lachnospiraceae bacterium]